MASLQQLREAKKMTQCRAEVTLNFSGEMTEATHLTWTATAYATKYPFMMAQALAQFQYQCRISNKELAKYLQCPLDSLPKLALCRKPLSDNDIQKIADYADCDRERLKQLLVQVEHSF